MKIRDVLFLPALLSTSVASLAAEKSIILSVPDMNCPSCPCMIEQSVKFLDGVQLANTDLNSRTYFVVYDDAITSVEDILGATTGIEYMSTVIELGIRS